MVRNRNTEFATRADGSFIGLDGTLTDPKESITRSLAHALEKLGI